MDLELRELPCPACAKPHALKDYIAKYPDIHQAGFVCPSCGQPLEPRYNCLAPLAFTVIIAPFMLCILFDAEIPYFQIAAPATLMGFVALNLSKHWMTHRFVPPPTRFQFPLVGAVVLFLLAAAALGSITLGSAKPLCLWLLSISGVATIVQYARERAEATRKE